MTSSGSSLKYRMVAEPSGFNPHPPLKRSWKEDTKELWETLDVSVERLPRLFNDMNFAMRPVIYPSYNNIWCFCMGNSLIEVCETGSGNFVFEFSFDDVL